MAITDKHHPAVKNSVAMKKYSQLFLLYSQHAMVNILLLESIFLKKLGTT